MEQPIRKITIGADPNNSLNYVDGGEMNIYIDNKPQKRTVCNIEEFVDPLDGTRYIRIHIKSGTESQLWKEIPKRICTIEYVVD